MLVSELILVAAYYEKLYYSVVYANFFSSFYVYESSVVFMFLVEFAVNCLKCKFLLNYVLNFSIYSFLSIVEESIFCAAGQLVRFVYT